MSCTPSEVYSLTLAAACFLVREGVRERDRRRGAFSGFKCPDCVDLAMVLWWEKGEFEKAAEAPGGSLGGSPEFKEPGDSESAAN